MFPFTSCGLCKRSILIVSEESTFSSRLNFQYDYQRIINRSRQEKLKTKNDFSTSGAPGAIPISTNHFSDGSQR